MINNTANKNNKLVNVLEAQMIIAKMRCVSQRKKYIPTTNPARNRKVLSIGSRIN